LKKMVIQSFIDVLIFIIIIQTVTWSDNKMSSKAIAYIRLKEEDKAILRKIAEYYDVSESDAVKIAVKHLAKELGLLSS